MKQTITALLCAAVLSFSLASCSTPQAQEDVLRVGMDLKFPPFSYIGDTGQAEGLEPLIAQAFGDYLGMEVEIVDTDFSLLIPALETGDVDILIADMSYTDERGRKAEFSDPYRYTQSLALVNRDYYAAMGITDDMAPEEFFHLDGSKFIGLAGTFGVLVPQSYGADVTEVTEIGSGILEVTSGTATALVASNEVVGFQAANATTTVVHPIGNTSASSFVVPLGDETLLQQANTFIATMYEDGGFYHQIRDQYDGIVADFMGDDRYGLDYIINPPN